MKSTYTITIGTVVTLFFDVFGLASRYMPDSLAFPIMTAGTTWVVWRSAPAVLAAGIAAHAFVSNYVHERVRKLLAQLLDRLSSNREITK